MINRITFFDTETTGKNSFFSEIISIYARTIDINTGMIIDELDEECSLPSYRFPDPGALLINKYPIEKLRKGQSSHEMLHKVHDYFKKHTPQICVAHYASFDFRMLHNSYFKNVITTDLYQLKTNGNILLCNHQLARAVEGFIKDNPLGVKNNLGNPCFKLGDLCRANDIYIDAHNAKGDVEAMIELHQYLKLQSKDIYDQVLLCSDARKSAAFINQNPVFFAALGADKNFRVRPLTTLGISGNEAICTDILEAFEDKDLLSDKYFNSLCGKEISKNQAIIKLPLNKGIPLFDSSYQDRCNDAKNLSSSYLFRKASELKGNSMLVELANRNLGIFKSYENEQIEQKIYSDGFPSNTEKSFITAFNGASSSKKLDVINHFKKILGSKNRFTKLAKRLMLENYPHLFSQKELEDHFEWYNGQLFKHPVDGKSPSWITFQDALCKIEDLIIKHPSDMKRLNQIRSFFYHEAYLNGQSIGDLLYPRSSETKFVEGINDEIRRRRR
jgi:exonuclease I